VVGRLLRSRAPDGWLLEHAADAACQCGRIVYRHYNGAPRLTNELTAARVVGDNDGRAGEKCFERYQPENFVFGGVHDNVGVGQRFNSTRAGQEPREVRAFGNSQLGCQALGRGTAAHIVASDDQPCILVRNLRERAYQRVDVFARRDLSKEQDDRLTPDPAAASEFASALRACEFIQVERVADNLNCAFGHPETRELPSLGRRNCQDSRGAFYRAAACHEIEQAFGVEVAFDDRCSAVGLNNIGNSSPAKVVRSELTRQVAARVQMGDVEVRDMPPKESAKTHREKGLLMIRQSIRYVGKQELRDAFAW